MVKKISCLKKIINKKVKFCEFALNNICTAKCKFCSIWQQPKKYSADIDKSLKMIDHLSNLGVTFITLTGGEPLLHPHYDKILKRCHDKNITTSILAADARLFTEKRLRALKEVEVDMVCISVDHHINAIASESRGIQDILTHIKRAVSELKSRNITTMASTLICKYNHETMDKLFEKCIDIGFDLISVNYPEFSESPVYTLGGAAIELSKDQLITALKRVKGFKKDYPNLINPVESFDSIIAFLQGDTPKYFCLGGYKTLFIDWNFKSYPCMHLARDMGDALALTQDHFIKKLCNDCNMSWYRDFSIYFQGMKSVGPLLRQLPLILKV